ncbi:MAG: hemerythrin domain-containing protein [Pseudomonadota bacterium]
MPIEWNGSVPGFDDPIALMRACHRRIFACIDTLERLARHLETHGADAEAQGAARRLLAYFHESAPHHHDDEDQDLFPLLREYRDHPESHPQLGDWVERLTREHDDLEAGWNQMEPALERIAAGEPASLDGARAWIDHYRTHLELEERAVLPLAEHLLTPEQLTRIGSAMARRRNVGIPNPTTATGDASSVDG